MNDCAFDGCERVAISRFHGSVESYCRSHWQQLNNGNPLTPIRAYKRATVKNDPTVRRCTGCEETKPLDEFYDRIGQAGKQSRCIECMVQMASVMQYMRTGKPREAARAILSMPDGLRKRYLDKYATLFEQGF